MSKLKSRKKGKKFENKVKNSLNSGAIWLSPLDLESDKFLIECKFTDQKGYRISLDLLDKIWSKSLDFNKLPRLVIGIRKNENEVFVLNCDVSIEKNYKKEKGGNSK